MDAKGKVKFGGKDVTDKFTCPGCDKLPEETVYQCQNGHVICHKCYPRLEICPRDLCRLQLDQSAPLRNLSAQTFLDGFKADCPFQDNGCETNKMYKHLVSSHGAECLYNFQKFGQLVNLCQKLGYPTCDFKVNDGNTAAAIEHFQSAHGFHLTKSGQLQMELEHFKEAITLKKTHYWTPVIVKLSARQGHLLVLPVQNEAKEFTCVSIWFPDSQNSRPMWLQSLIHVEYTMPQRDRSQSCKLSFVQRPVSIAQADNILLETLPHSIQGLFLTEHMRDEVAMQIICKIKETATTTAMQGRMTKFICKMNPPLQIDTSTGDTEKAKKRLDDAENSSKGDSKSIWNFWWELYEKKSKDEGYTTKELVYLMTKALLLIYVVFVLLGFIKKGAGVGELAKPGEFPHAVQFSLSIGRRFDCEGSILAPSVILTSAECAFALNITRILIPNVEVLVTAGTLQKVGEEESADEDEQTRIVKRYVIHPQFNLLTLQSNIALLFLDKPLIYTDKVNSIQLPPPTAVYSWGTFLGWGKKAGSYWGEYHLKKLDLVFQDREACKRDFLKIGESRKVTDLDMCAKLKEEIGFCLDYSGSSLICQSTEGKVATLRKTRTRARVTPPTLCGMASWKRGGCGNPNTTHVFLDVSKYVDWIRKEASISAAVMNEPKIFWGLICFFFAVAVL